MDLILTHKLCIYGFVFHLLYLCMHVWCLWVSTCAMDGGWPWRPEESIGSPGVGVTGSCEPPTVGAWD